MKNLRMPRIVELLLVFLFGALATFFIVTKLQKEKVVNVTENITKTEKEVTVTDSGIADAVEKVYNAVVVVSTYKDDRYIAAGTGFVYKRQGDKYYILMELAQTDLEEEIKYRNKV